MSWPGWASFVPPGETPTVKPNKYHATKVQIDGYTFDSKKEGGRYTELLLLKGLDGHVERFIVHPRFELTVNGRVIGSYTPDFYVVWANGEVTVEDVKGGQATKTQVYRLRRKLFEACHAPLVVTEI